MNNFTNYSFRQIKKIQIKLDKIWIFEIITVFHFAMFKSISFRDLLFFTI